jgi:hypothetical protein
VAANPMVDWLFRNRQTGEISIGQSPNLPMVVFSAARFARRVFRPSGRIASAVDLVGTAALAVWAVDEVVRGVNPWRRAVGTGALLWLVPRIGTPRAARLSP